MQDDEVFITTRQQIHEFIADNFTKHELKQVSSITRDIEPKLKYCVIDRYAGTYISGGSFIQLSKKVNQFRHIDLFFAFGYLCIGYTDPLFGCRSLDAFATHEVGS